MRNPFIGMQIKKLLLVLFTMLILITPYSCKHQPEDFALPDNCNLTQVTYLGTVVPILENNCYGCHNSQVNNGGINLLDYNTLSNLAKSGKLIGVINKKPGYAPMPPDYKIDSCDIAKIEKWINDTIFTPPGGNDHPCDPDTVYFENVILPLIVSSCATTDCHDVASAQGDIILVDYTSIIENGKIKPGDPNESKLYKKITDNDPNDIMPPPPNEPLSQEQIQKMRIWIEQGALNNHCDEDCDTTNVTFSDHIWPMIENNCFGCHSGGSPGGGIYLTDYANIVSAVESGKLWGTINHIQGFSPMPKNTDKLSDCKINQLRIWIEDGTPNN